MSTAPQSPLDRGIARNGLPKAADHTTQDAKPRPITPTINPLVIDEAHTGNLAERARRDLASAREALEQLSAFEAAVFNDRSLPQAGKDISIYAARQKATDRVTEILGRLADAAHEAEKAAAGSLNAAAALKHRGRFDQEVRAHVAALPEEKRAMFLQGRAQAGDIDSTVALLDAPRFLSGPDLTDDAAAALRLVAQRKVAPDAAAHLDEVRAVAKRIQAAFHAGIELVPNKDPRIEDLMRRAKERETAGAALL